MAQDDRLVYCKAEGKYIFSVILFIKRDNVFVILNRQKYLTCEGS